MSKNKSPKNDLLESLMASFNEISELLRMVEQPNRFKILILLLNGPLTFQELLQKTHLKKTALANHLVILVESSFIDKFQRGHYRITEGGHEFLKVIYEWYQKQNIREKKSMETVYRKQIVDAFLERGKS